MIEYEHLGLLNQKFKNELTATFGRVLDGGWFVLGKEVELFEKEFASFCGSEFCSGVANGLDALILGLRARAFQPGSEVIVPANTYIATILAVVQCGLKPVLVEPDPATCNVDPRRIEEAITPKTVAILPVHLYGKCCAMDEIMTLAAKHHLFVMEDCAQAHGATFKGRKAGTFGEVGAFSFYPTKNLGALGDGGALTTNQSELDRYFRLARNYGSEKKYYNQIAGVNSRLDEVQAAFLRVKLKALDELTEHKRKLASLYQQGLKQDFVKPVVHPDYGDVHHIFHVRHERRDDLRKHLLSNGIKTEIHYPVPPHRQPALQGLVKGSYPISESIHATILSLPVSAIHSESEILHVIEVMNRF